MKIFKSILSGLSDEPIKLLSRYTAEVCILKLKEAVTDSASLNSLMQQNLLVGSISDDSVSLSFNGTEKNSFRKTLFATIRDHESGAVIIGQFNVNIIPKLLFFTFSAILTAILIFLLLMFLLITIFNNVLPPAGLVMRALGVLVVLIGFLGIGKSSMISAINETKMVKQFLIALLDAEEA